MKIIKEKFIKKFIMMANDGWNFGWHERNGGNLSYRIKNEEINRIKKRLDTGNKFYPLEVSVPQLAGEYFLVTGSQKYFRNILLNPIDNIGIVEINDRGDRYRICWGLKRGGKPTSEFPTHLMIHQAKKNILDSTHRVVYHAHVINLVALTFMLPLNDKAFTNELWKAATECAVIFPEGVGVIPWMVPGGSKIADATSKQMEKYNVVVWPHHGAFCSGPDFDETFALMHTIEKSSDILLKVMSMTDRKLQSITDHNLREMAKSFNVKLTAEFLE